MKTYIINLKEATERREYVQKQLALLASSLSVEFVEAIDGRRMSKAEQDKFFDLGRFRLRYTKEARPGEIGCTLSHQKCYRKLVESGEEYALILEDDIVVRRNVELMFSEIKEMLVSDQPCIILLSGWYWYLSAKPIAQKYSLAKVYDAFLTHAYVINRAAASLLIEHRPFITADDWFYIRKKGVKIYAFLPHLLDQEWSGAYPTTINQNEKEQCAGMWKRKIEILLHSILLKLLFFFKRFEKP